MAGSPFIGDNPTYSLDTSLGTYVARYSVIQVSQSTEMTNNMMAGLCGTGATSRGLAIGVAFKSYPFEPQIWSGTPAPQDIGHTVYDPSKSKNLSVKEEGFSWILVKIPAGGASKSIKSGDFLVPSVQAAGSAQALPASVLTASYDSSTIIADIQEAKNIFAQARSMIHVPTSATGYKPALGQGTVTSTLTALTNAETFGYVFAKLGK